MGGIAILVSEKVVKFHHLRYPNNEVLNFQESVRVSGGRNIGGRVFLLLQEIVNFCTFLISMCLLMKNDGWDV